MEIEVRGTWGRPLGAALLVLAVLIAFAAVGRFVTPVDAGRVEVLTPDRWQARKLAREVRREVLALSEDGQRLRDLVEDGRPSAVDAMLLAQRIYARHRTGTSATGPAREALIAAAEAVARYATGTASRGEALDAVNRALALIRELDAQREGRTRQNIPFVTIDD